MRRLRNAVTALHTAGLLLVLAAAATAQDYPTKPVRLIVPFTPGGSVDTVARIVAARLTEQLGRQIVVESRGGASGIIGTELAVKSPPDGHTLLMMSFTHTMSPWLHKLPYDPRNAFIPVALLGKGISVLSSTPSLPVNSVPELIALAKARPKQLHFANAGVGTFTHVSSILFAMMAGIEVEHVPFKGSGPAMTDVMGGHSQLILNSIVIAQPHVRSGRLKALGISDTRRSALLPELPTIDEAGVPGYEASNWWGIAVPAGTPAPIVARLHREITAVQNSEDVMQHMARDGATIVQLSTAEFRTFFLAEMEKWGKVVREANLKVVE
jgi:tripartite-type tricarboxylate transporter receptor subunit TctC